MLSKQDVIKLWDYAQNKLKTRFPRYHKAIQNYNLVFGRKRTCYGTCKYGPKTIEIHMYLCKHVQLKEVLDTILHEMAHAIDKEINGRSSGHGLAWKRIAQEIGAKPQSRSSKGANVVKESKYVLVLTKEDGTSEYICGKHRKKKTQSLNTLMKTSWLTNDKMGTMGKLMLISWNTFIVGQKSGKITLKEIQKKGY